MFSLTWIVCVALVSIAAAERWGQICARNYTNKIRGCDRYGCGHYMAQRYTHRIHKGVDVVCRDGVKVLAPFSGKSEGRTLPFHHGRHPMINNGIQFRGSGFCIRLFFMNPQSTYGWFNKGDILGRMMSMQREFPHITSHIHIQNCDLSDPTPYITVAAGPWERICAGNPNNALRGCDKLGCGHYNASRDRHVRHKGVDVVCSDGSTVYAPFSVMIDRRVNPFSPGKNKPINNGIQLRGSGFCIQMFFIRPVKYRGRIFKRQKIGVLLPMQSVYPGITSLVHVQNCDRSDPTHNL